MPLSNIAKIQNDIAKLQTKLDTVKERRKRTALNQIFALMDSAGLSVEDVAQARKSPQKKRGPKPGASHVRRTRAPRQFEYRNPADGKVWSGMGKRPGWIHELINSGRSLDEVKVPTPS